MKKTLLSVLAFYIAINSYSQVISFEKIRTFTINDIVDLGNNLGLPNGIFTPEFDVDYYKVVYMTPYIYPDSLVEASGAVAIPQNAFCEYPLVGYGHGTQSRRMDGASSLNGGQWEVGVLYASTGYVVSLPDYLGLGFADPRVPIHPYTHSYSQANTIINSLRASRHIADSMDVELNGQVFLFGYSQGGGATVATVKEIQENYANEFSIAGSAPMSGAYDLKDAQVDLIASDSIYPTPGYLPFVVLAYNSIYGDLFSDVSEFLKPPYDTLIPPLFYDGNTGIGQINVMSEPVPKHMVIDSVVNAFLTDSLHPLRLHLNENDLIRGWYPQSPMKLIYCEGDDQVSYLNSVNAYNSWQDSGAANIEKADLGDFDHGNCALFAFLSARNYFDSLAVKCTVGVNGLSSKSDFLVSPNPVDDNLSIRKIEGKDMQDAQFVLFDAYGKLVRKEQNINGEKLQLAREGMSSGIYFYQLHEGDILLTSGKVIFK